MTTTGSTSTSTSMPPAASATLMSSSASSSTTLADHWVALATASLLGTDRRPAPQPPDGPLADLVAEAQPADDADSVLVQVAALAAARRAGLQPGRAPGALSACADDPRPLCPPAASRRLPELIDVWPELVDELLALVCAGGYQLSGEHVVTLLARHRHDPVRRPLVERAAGPLAAWLSELFPTQFATRRPTKAGSAGARTDAEPGDAVEPFPLPPDLAMLVDAPAPQVIATLVDGLTRGTFANRHRPLLVHLVRRLPVDVLNPLADALARAGTNASTLGLTMSLADLARTRAAMIAELAPPAGDASR